VSFQKMIKDERTTNEISVPMTPKRVMYPKFLTKFDFFKLYPAAKMIGGSIKTKNVDSLNWKGSIPAYRHIQ
jgi:hypothetical protein